MASEIARYYLTQHPRDSMRVLEAARITDLKRFIGELPREVQAVTLSHVLPQTAASYLGGLDPRLAAEIVEPLRAVDAAHVLGVLTQTKRRPILDALPEEKRTTVRHLLRYPDDSVGALMLTRSLVCRADATVRRTKQLVRRYAQTELPLVIVLDDAMHPIGQIALSRLLNIREREQVKDHMRAIAARLPAYAAISTVLTAPAWNNEDHLPVVDATGRYVGLLPKARLHRHALAAEVDAADSDDFHNTVIALADMIWGPAAEMLARATTTPAESTHE